VAADVKYQLAPKQPPAKAVYTTGKSEELCENGRATKAR
jgi:hypothetical protein